MIPTSDHNEALSGDTLYSAFLNYEWRMIVIPFVIAGMEQLAETIENETERQNFEVRYGALIDDLYNEDVVDGTPVGTVAWFPSPEANIPEKWLKCDNDPYLETDYPELYAILVNFQFVDGGINKFRVPALTDKFLWGATLDAHIGDVGGEIEHTLTIAEMPAHGHDISKANVTGTAIQRGMTGNNTQVGLQQTSSVGGDGAHNNMPPYMRGYWMIKALP